MPPLLEIRNLVHQFPEGTLGLDGVSFTLNRGEFVVLAGANGSGKTLLMRHMNGLLLPRSGEILLEGIPITQDLKTVRQRVGLVFQDAEAQIVGQTVTQDLAFGPENLKLPREEIQRRVALAVEQAGLAGFENRRPRTLSGGEKRRLSTGGVLAMAPDLIVLDEPFTGLDWPGSAALLEVLDALHNAGKTLLVITHDLDKVLAHAQRVILMEAGRTAADGRPGEILEILEKHGVRRPPGPVEAMSWKRRHD